MQTGCHEFMRDSLQMLSFKGFVVTTPYQVSLSFRSTQMSWNMYFRQNMFYVLLIVIVILIRPQN